MPEKVSIFNTLHVWACLERARDGVSSYGNNISEIYVKHLLPTNYDATLSGNELWLQASRTLYNITKKFCEVNNVNAYIQGRPIGDWMNDYQLVHKCDVRIEVINERNKKGKTRIVRKVC